MTCRPAFEGFVNLLWSEGWKLPDISQNVQRPLSDTGS